MKTATRLFVLLLASAPAMAASDLDRWTDRELVPYVIETLTTHPRFKDQRIRFVVFDGGGTAATANELALDLRDRLVDAAIEAGGIRIAMASAARAATGAPFDCTQTDAHYAIGIAVERHSAGQWGVTLRARDLVEARLVPGFGRTWHGYLDPRERSSAARRRHDASLLGERGAPFESHQADLLAAHLAHRLACAVARQTRGLYVVPGNVEADGDDVFDGTLALIGNNVTSHPAFDLAAGEREANVALSGKAHRIDGSLYQYWLTLTPVAATENLEALSVSAYVRMPAGRERQLQDDAVVRTPPPHRHGPGVAVPRAGNALLGALRLRPAGSSHRCQGVGTGFNGARYGAREAGCSLIEATAETDAIVFLLSHRPSLGLVRIDDGACRRRAQPMLVREAQTLAFAVPWVPDGASRVRDVSAWQTAPAGEIYYALAVSDSGLARRIANHVDRLPLACGTRRSAGMRHAALGHWLADLAAIAGEADGRLDWRAIELKQVY